MEKSLKVVLGSAGGVIGLCVLCTCVGTVANIFSDDKHPTTTTTPSYLPLLDPNSVTPVPVDSPTPSLSPSSIPVIVVPSTTQAAPLPEPTENTEEEMQTGVTPGAYCSPEGAKGKGENGGIYTCKPSSTDTRNRWRK